MTIITAKVIEDSVAESNGVRLTTLQLQYPRFIHAEFMTHRVFSRNASSSRAIPVAKVIEQVRTDPAMPIHWGKNQPGMQANEELQGDERAQAIRQWKLAAERAADCANIMNTLGVHKQVANRLLEPFQYMHVIVTATEWLNFFDLRAHPDAQPEIHALALVMRHAFEQSKPNTLREDDWHLPYVTRQERLENFGNVELLLKISAARCARVSYLTHDGQTPSIEKDIALYDRLVGSVPLHASPIEHQATPMGKDGQDLWSGNFRGWTQYRKIVESTVQ
jgi:thymidylate synthase ThyX